MSTPRTAIATIGAALLTCVGFTLVPAVVSAQEGPSNISIVRSPADEQGPCMPAPMSMRGETRSDGSSFTLSITTSAPLCDPIDAVAAIYAMPGNGAPWPQRLVETAPFTISEAGVIDVVFTKTCDPVQFDVVTGDTPELIAPLGAHHGPLLFRDDTSTSLQHWGWQCDERPATTAPPTTDATSPPPTTDATTSTTTTEAEVLGATTSSVAPIAAGADQTLPPIDEPLVLAAGEEAGGPSELAFAGADAWSVLFAGAALVFAGGSLLSLRQARRRQA